MKHPIGAAVVALVVSVVLGERAPVLADPIATSWSGASASVNFGQQTQSQQGATAQASTGGSLSVNYLGVPYWVGSSYTRDDDQGTVTGNLAASAGSDPAHLLQVTASSNAPDPGTLEAGAGGTVAGAASASWTNDAAIVTAPAGSSLPNTIQLNFTLTFSDPHGIGPNASLTATYNGTQLSYWGSDMTAGPAASLYGQPTMGLHSEPGNAVDSSSIVSSTNWQTQLTNTFHIDLSLSQSGLSAPLSLGLQLTPTMGLYSNSPVEFSGLTANIALTSVTLPDGTPLSALGDLVSFESGLAAPTAAPEPASLLVWGLVATAGAAAVRRRRAGAEGR